MDRFAIKCALLLAAVLFCTIRESHGADFRVENHVFVEGKDEPENRSLTLFQGGIVYDFMSEPSEVTIFDKPTGHFFLLNRTNQQQTEVAISAVEGFMEKLRQLAYKQKDPLSKFFADPKFEERFETESGELTLTSPWVTYRVVIKAARNPALAAQYREFSDWQSRLNAMLNPGSRPPLARLQVNEALAKREVLPGKVHLTMTSLKNETLQKMKLRSEHDFTFNLLPTDLEQIERVREARGKFKLVPYEKYEKNRTTGH
jgi:hypothetical protein